MSFADWKGKKQQTATATVATLATDEPKKALKNDNPTLCVADVASVAVAVSENKQKSEPPTKTELLPNSPVFGGGDSVILANSTNTQDTNTPHTKGEIKPVLKVVAKSELQKDGVKTESYSPLEDGRKKPFSLNNYSHCVTCNQCEHLALTGTCQRLSKRVIPEALRECTFFELRQKERLSVVKTTPYSQDELHRLFNQAAKTLYFHLIDCEQCSLEDTRYCVEGFGLGNTFDCLLLCFDDAADKRYKLMNQVIKARVSGHRVYMLLKT